MPKAKPYPVLLKAGKTDDKVWTFALRPDLKWSNDEALTAHDFVYALRRLTDPATGSPYGSYLVDAKVMGAKDISEGKAKPDTLGVKALDDHTLQITLNEPLPYLVDLLMLPVTYAVHEPTIKQHQEKWLEPTNIVVSGAYKLKEWQLNSHLTIEPNSHYFDDKNTKINNASFLPISGSSEISRYKAGELEITAGIHQTVCQNQKRTRQRSAF